MPAGVIDISKTRASPWVEAIAANGVESAETDISNPRQVDGNRHDLIIAQDVYLRIACQYDDAASSITSPVINVFGNDGVSEFDEILTNPDGDQNITVTCAETTDVNVEPDLFMSVPVVVNAMSCRIVKIRIQTAISHTGGDASKARIVARTVPTEQIGIESVTT